MFGIFKKTVEVVAPISGKVANLAAVPDPVFADKVVGDGVAIDEINSDIVCAPVDGIVSLVFPTNHAFVITTKNDIEVLVHIGIETVGLGDGIFERLVEEGKTVKTGESVIRFKLDLLKNLGCALISPVVITTPDKIAKIEGNIGNMVVAGQDVIFSYKPR